MFQPQPAKTTKQLTELTTAIAHQLKTLKVDDSSADFIALESNYATFIAAKKDMKNPGLILPLLSFFLSLETRMTTHDELIQQNFSNMMTVLVNLLVDPIFGLLYPSKEDVDTFYLSEKIEYSSGDTIAALLEKLYDKNFLLSLQQKIQKKQTIETNEQINVTENTDLEETANTQNNQTSAAINTALDQSATEETLYQNTLEKINLWDVAKLNRIAMLTDCTGLGDTHTKEVKTQVMLKLLPSFDAGGANHQAFIEAYNGPRSNSPLAKMGRYLTRNFETKRPTENVSSVILRKQHSPDSTTMFAFNQLVVNGSSLLNSCDQSALTHLQTQRSYKKK